MKKLCLYPCALFLLVLTSALPSFATRKWIEVKSEHFTVLTDGTERQGKHVAHDFEQMRNVLSSIYKGIRLDDGVPLLIFATADHQAAAEIEPQFRQNSKTNEIVGIFEPHWERKFAIVNLERSDREMQTGFSGGFNAIFHEYIHSVLRMNFRYLPTWADEGLAEFFGSTKFTTNEVQIGYPSVRTRDLRARTLLPIDDMLDTNGRSKRYHSWDESPMFYAESWAMIHYMELGDGMERGKKLASYLDAIQAGANQKKAFTDAFGDTKKFYEDLDKYCSSLAFRGLDVKGLPQVDDSQFKVRALPPAEALADIGGFKVWRRNLKEARTDLEEAIKEDPKLAKAYEFLGATDLDEGKDADALKNFSQAVELDSSRYLSVYYKAMLEAQADPASPEKQAGIYQACLKALSVDPQFAPAYVQLSLYHLRRGSLQNALLMAKKAAVVQPSRSGYLVLVAHILELQEKYKEAGETASFVAARWSGGDHDEAVAVWNRIPEAQRPKVQEDLADQVPKDTKALTGVIHSITCADKDKNIKFGLDLNSDGKTEHFDSETGFGTSFSDTIWYGADHFSICHHLDGMPAVVRYRPAKDPGFTRSVAELEIRMELPTPPASIPSALAEGKPASSSTGEAATRKSAETKPAGPGEETQAKPPVN